MIGRRSKDKDVKKTKKRAWEEEDEDDGEASGSGDEGKKRKTESEAMKRLREDLEERKRIEEENARREKEEKEAPKTVLKARSPLSAVERNLFVFFDVEIRSRRGPNKGEVISEGRMEFELFKDTVPRTAENFYEICRGDNSRKLTYANSVFHRIIPGFMAQGGDITDGDGTGGDSIYGPSFADENFNRLHNARGILSMANSGPHSNNSQFFMLFRPQPNLDRRHVVFGKLIRDVTSLLRSIENAGGANGEPKNLVTITKCGSLFD